jgi:hypothetical protein
VGASPTISNTFTTVVEVGGRMKKLILRSVVFALFVYTFSWAVAFLVFWGVLDFETVKVALLTSIVIIPIVATANYFYIKK